MNNLQKYLEEKYSSKEEKANLVELSVAEIARKRKEDGITALLEGGELDLREYPNLEELIVDNQFLKTPITKLNTFGLSKLKEIIWPEFTPEIDESESEKSFYKSLGISEDPTKKILVKKIERLARLFSQEKLNGKEINVYFANSNLPREELSLGQLGNTEEKDNKFHIYLQLDQEDKNGNFSSTSVLATFFYELTSTLERKKFSPSFWQLFWLKKESIADWAINEIGSANFSNKSIFFFSATSPQDAINKSETIPSDFAEEIWDKIIREIIESTNKELENKVEEEKLWASVSLENDSLQISYHPQNPLGNSMNLLLRFVPLESELVILKKRQESLPTTENFDRLTRQKQALEDCLHNYTDENNYQAILNRIKEIK